MQTSNTLHVQRCSEPGCVNDALITNAFGKNVQSPKGACSEHLDVLKSTAERQRELDDSILADLGFDITGFKAA